MRFLVLSLQLLWICSCIQKTTEPPLLGATRRGDLKEMKRCLEQGSDVNTRGRSGKTALMIASSRGDVSAVRLLLENEVRVNLREQTGETALSHAAFEGHEDVLLLLLQQQMPKDILTEALIAATAAGRRSVIELLIEKGVDPAKANRYGVTAAMIAEHIGQRHLLDLLRKRR